MLKGKKSTFNSLLNTLYDLYHLRFITLTFQEENKLIASPIANRKVSNHEVFDPLGYAPNQAIAH